MRYELQYVADKTGTRLIGDGKREVGGVASVESATPNDLVFVESEEHLPKALVSQAGAVVAGEFAVASGRSKPLLISDQPRLAFARAARLIRPPQRRPPGIHSTAAVHSAARLGDAVSIQENVVIREDVIIGDHVFIGAGTFIGAGSHIGDDCEIKGNVTIYPGVRLGARVIVHGGAVLGSDGFGFVRDHKSGRYEKFPQIGSLEIGDDVEIGANCTIDRGALDRTVIGSGTKLDNLVHVGHNVRIGEDVVIAAQTGISGSAIIEGGVIIAGQVGIADHVTVERGAILGAQCGVPSNKVIRGSGILFWGTPARPIRQYLKELATLSRLAKKPDSR